MKYILGKKLEMTQRFADNGTVIPVTLVQAGPCAVIAIKTEEKDGYSAVQIGYGDIKEKRVPKPVRGQLKGKGTFRYLREFRDENPAAKVGDTIAVSAFEKGDHVSVSGVSKGKGFQGVVKRHGFHGSPKSHGHKDQLRMPGSIGSTGPQRVFKGTRMGGQMGNKPSTVTNLEVIDVNEKTGILALRGAVPGPLGGLVSIKTR